MNGAQLIWSGAAVVIGYGLYAYGKRMLVSSDIDRRQDSGIDPGWKDDPVIASATKNNQIPGRKFPVCEIWNDDLQVYLDSGLPYPSADLCFATYTDDALNARFSTSESDMYFRRQDPFQETPDNAGTCFFQGTSGGTYTFPDYGEVAPGVPMTPVNRSARLCFAAGQTAPDAGRMFIRKRDKQTIIQPGVTVSGTFGPDNRGLSAAPLKTECEQLIVDSNNQKYWTIAFPGIAGITDMTTCLARGTVSQPTRWRDVDAGSFVFTNPNTKARVQINATVY